MLTSYDGDEIEISKELPLLPIRDIVIYPFMILPLFIGRRSSIKAIDYALKYTDQLIFLSSQKDISVENPKKDQIYTIGIAAIIMRMRKLPDGRIKILAQGLSKAKIVTFKQTKPFYITQIEKRIEFQSNKDPRVDQLIMEKIKAHLEKIIGLGKILPPDLLMILEDVSEPSRFADIVSANLNLHVSEGQIILETSDISQRLIKINNILLNEIDVLSMEKKINSKKEDDQFLKEQINIIKNELNENISMDNDSDDLVQLKQKILQTKMPLEAQEEALKQFTRLKKMHVDSSETHILRNYLEWLCELPWSISSEDNLNLDKAQEILDEDHFKLHNIKERILEFLAVIKLKKNKIKGPILCFIGPPGVGKTSLGRSIARAIDRKFIRISLGGIKDEAEIRGHRRTYVGSFPGRIMQAMKKAQINNPVILLDEIDKIAGDFKGDPSTALLEVLDPEQNHSFRDHYINLSFDLSNVMFIATGNILENIAIPLRDRMEVISLSGYSQEEKTAISIKYLIPKQIKENGIDLDDIEFTSDGLQSLIKNYTYESGLRNLERQIAALCRKIALKIVRGDHSKTILFPKMIVELLGPPLFTEEEKKKIDEVGVARGLAWTAVGGEVLLVEANKMKGQGLTLTGRLGDVMRESALTAIGFIKSHIQEFNLEEKFFSNNEIHIHLPSCSIPKDGPSAGITMATVILSLATQIPLRKDVAMTGEITLNGKILSVGGLQEKILAALRADIKTIIIPWGNRKDLVEIPKKYRTQLTFVPVKNFIEIIGIAFVEKIIFSPKKDFFIKDSEIVA